MALRVISKLFTGFLNVKPSEYERFILMLVHAFLSGLGIALSYTLINILIVGSGHVHDYLPILYLATAGLLLTKGYIYAHLEHNFQPQKLFSWVLISLFLWSFLMYLNLRVWDSFLIIALAYCSYFVVYYLSNLEYWGTASLLFDVRQGKRLFGLLSSGESVAKIMGYAMTPLVITFFNPATVYFLVALCFGGAYFIFNRLAKKYKPSMSVVHHTYSQKSSQINKTGTVLTIVTIRDIFKLDNFRKNISIFAFLSTLTFFLLHYVFLLKVEAKHTSIKDIAVFFATLLTIAKILNLLIKVFLSSRLCRYLGLKVVLLILPICLLLAIIVGIVGISTGQAEESFIIWIFTAIIVIDEVFRTSLYTPAYLTLFQPLTKVKRLEGHTITKGIMEPLGLGVSGLLLLALTFSGNFKLETLTPFVLIFLVAWIASGNKVFKAYLGILEDALKSKILNRGTLQLSKNEYGILKNQKLLSKDPLERLYAMQMLVNSLSDEEKRSCIEGLLVEKDAFVIKNALVISRKLKMNGLSQSIMPLIDHESEEVSKMAIYEFARTNLVDSVEYFKYIYDAQNLKTKSYIIGAAIRHCGLNGAIEFGRELLFFISSESVDHKILACEIISDISNIGYFHPLIDLLHDESASVREKAIEAAGNIKNPILIEHILANRNKKKMRLVIRKAFSNFGKYLAPHAYRLLTNSSTQDKIDLLRLFERNQSHELTEVVYKYVNDNNFDVRREAISTLFSKTPSSTENIEINLSEAILNIANRISQMIKLFPKIKHRFVRDLVYNEIYHIQLKLLFQAMSFRYSKKLFKDVIENCYSSLKTNKTLALELLDNSLVSKDKLILVSLIEAIFDLDQLAIDSVELDESLVDKFIEEVLKNGAQDYSSWLIANFMRISTNRNIEINATDELLENDVRIIKQESKRLFKLTA